MIETISRFIKNIGFNMVADLSKKLVNALLVFLISHFIGVSAMGSYSIAYTYFSFGLLFSYWGLGNLLTREVARDKSNYGKYISSFGIIRVVFALISILAINLIVINLDYSEQTKLTIQIISLGILPNTLNHLIFSLFIAFEELKYLSIISLIISILRIIISYILLQLGGSVVAIALFYSIMEFVSLLISLVFASRYLRDFKIKLDLNFCVNQIKIAFPFFLIAILVIFDSRIEILLISFFFNEALVGYYTAMNTIMGGIALFSEGIRNAVFPIFARYQYQSPESLNKIILLLGKYISLITFPIAIGGFFFADKIIHLFFDYDYDISITLLQIIIWTFIGYTLSVVAVRLLMVHNKEKQVVISLFISGILTLLLNILLAPSLGLVGIAAVRVMTSYVFLFLCLYYLKKQGYRIIEPKILLQVIFASIVLFLFVYLLNHINTYLALFSGYVLYACIIWITKVIDPKDIKLWRDIINNIFKRSWQYKSDR